MGHQERSAIVTGASRGLGRGIATALAQAGLHVVGVAHDTAALDDVRDQLGDAFTPIAADAADPVLAGHLIDEYSPHVLVLNAGAVPLPRPVQHHTWQSFSRHWDVDVQHAFHWTREALLRPLDPGSTVVAISSGAALRGSPLSGGYAGAKAAIRFLTSYAAEESRRDGLGIRFVSVLPQMTPAARVGRVGATAYAAREGVDVAAFVESLGPVWSPEQAGTQITELITAESPEEAYVLTAAGLNPLP